MTVSNPVPSGTGGKVEMLEWALRYAAKGWKVFPLHTPDGGGSCSCGRGDCGSVGKHPRTSNGVKDATDDIQQIRQWWIKWPHANIGVATGKASGIVVFDADGMRPCLRFQIMHIEERDSVFTTLRASTGRPRGVHFVYEYPADGKGVPNSTSKIAKGLDVKGDGGYVVVAPSLHASGKRYEWRNVAQPEEMSDWLLRRVRTATKPPTPIISSASAVIPKGRRNMTLAQRAGSMRRLGFSSNAIAAALLEINKADCAPPLPEAEVIQIAQSIGRYPAAAPVAAPALLPFRTARELAGMTPANIPWIAKPWIAEGCVTEVDGKIKAAGKTTWLTYLCRAVLDGQPFMGEPTAQSPVIFLTEQSGTSFCEALRRAQLLRRDDLHILALHEAFGRSLEAIMKETVEKARDRGAKLIVVDTLARWAGLRGDMENSAGDGATAVAPLKEAASIHGLAVAFARHERKSGGPVGDSARGSSAIGGEVDVILSIRRPSGGYAANVRAIESLSRLGETPEDFLVELVDGVGYQPFGGPRLARMDDTAQKLLEVLPLAGEGEMTMAELAEATGKARTTLQRALELLEEEGLINKRRDPGPTSPILYWRAPEETDTEK
jgi:DNA-binding transcriptional ArsR family regulator